MCSASLYVAEIWTLWKVDKKYLESLKEVLREEDLMRYCFTLFIRSE